MQLFTGIYSSNILFKLTMEFSSSSRFGRLSKKGPQTPINKRYRCNLQMYTMPPDGIVSLSDFDQMAVDRLKGSYNSVGS